MKVVLVHPTVELPPERAPGGPFINIMAQGLMGLADRLSAAGHQVEILHTGLERRLDPDFDLVRAIRAAEPGLVGISLHWHHQLGPAGRIVEALAQRVPDLPIVLGGMTATAFSEEILKAWPSVRFVLRGEAEGPLVALAELLEAAPEARSSLGAIPNLSWQSGGQPRSNPIGYLASREALDQIRFCRRDLIRHGAHYNAQFAASSQGWDHAAIFYLTAGRGCSVDCAFCSGGASGHRRLADRKKLVFRSARAVIRDIRDALDQGHGTLCLCFDPPPQAEAYYQDLFDRIREDGLRCAMVFECYRPPDQAFLKAFASTFERSGSRLSFSPTVGDERLRRSLLGSPYSNRTLERSLRTCRDLGLATTLYFATLPQESPEQLEESLSWQAGLVDRFGCRLVHAPIEMEPGAPWELDPVRYGLVESRSGFEAYALRHGMEQTIGARPSQEVGYLFEDLDARLVRIRSHGLEPLTALGLALAWCGQDSDARWLLPAAGREDEALAAIGDRCPGDFIVLLSDAGPWPDWPRLAQLAARLGPRTRAGRFDPAGLAHRRWSAGRRPEAPRIGSLRVLHLADGRAAEALLDDSSLAGDWPERVVLAEQCRFAPAPCPARRAGLLAMGRDACLRTCPSSPDLGPGPLTAVCERVERAVARAQRERGCATCEVRQSCSRCPFTGRIPVELFCELRRRLGPAGLAPAAGRKMEPRRTGQPAIGWDD